jgi:copper(I)-binding protein
MLKHLIAACVAAVLAASAVASADAQEYRIGSIKIEVPWIRATPTGAKVGGGYVKITNIGSEADRLVGGTLVSAGRVEVHEMTMDSNIMRMRRMANGLEIKPGQSVELKPGSYHLMFMDLKSGFKDGQRIKGTLQFANAGTVEVEYAVQGLAAQSGHDTSGKAGGHDGMGGMKH